MVKFWLKNRIKELYPNIDFDVLTPPNPEMGDYSVNLAFVLAKKESINPIEAGERLAKEFSEDKEIVKYFNRIEFVRPGFVNFYFSEEFLRSKLAEIVDDNNYGNNDSLKDKKVVIEFTDPNPFKLFHIGHLMSNTIGESIARLYEASGAKVTRVNYQGDVGLHVAKAVWGMMNMDQKVPEESVSLKEKMEFLGKAYAFGAKSYENLSPKVQIEEINTKIYDRSDDKVNKLYDDGKKWSLEYFETIYKRLGTKFEHYFFESETAKDGLKVIEENKNIFTQSDGALIFKGEDHGLHNRVFINSQGLPTYETKELGLNKKKFEMYSPDLSIVITGNEINDYFKVLLKVMELTMLEVAKNTKHIGHGMMRFASGKMSSRTGDVITAESLINELVEKIKNRESIKEKDEKDSELVAIGALKYSILKQSIGQDIIFDPEKALSIKGDSAPYIQYAKVRLNSVFEKSDVKTSNPNLDLLKESEELLLMRKLIKFPEIIAESTDDHQINRLALYVYELAASFHNFYEKHRVIVDEKDLQGARVVLCRVIALVLGNSLKLMGISSPGKM